MTQDTIAQEPTDRYRLVPGKRYRISLEDCCVLGWLTDTFVGYGRVAENPEDNGIAMFANAELENLYGWEAFEVLS